MDCERSTECEKDKCFSLKSWNVLFCQSKTELKKSFQLSLDQTTVVFKDTGFLSEVLQGVLCCRSLPLLVRSYKKDDNSRWTVNAKLSMKKINVSHLKVGMSYSTNRKPS